MRRNLSGSKLVITGAARGIGEKVARLAAARGARVALIGLEPDRLRALADDLGPTASWREADVRDSAALRSAIDDCAITMGGIDITVANAGVAAYGTVRQADEASFERVLDINLNGVFRTLKYATPMPQARPEWRGSPWPTARRCHTSVSPSASYILRGSTRTSSEAPRRTCPH